MTNEVPAESLNRLIRTVHFIPHLQLFKSFDAQALQRDFMKVPQEWIQPYRSTQKEMASYVAANWLGASVFSPDGTLHNDLTESYENYDGRSRGTPLADRCQYFSHVCQELGGQSDHGMRMRLMFVKPKARLTWHSHQFDGGNNYKPWMLVCHVPIFTPKTFRYSVMSVEEFRLRDMEKFGIPTIYTKTYQPGETWVFNSFHMHNIFNDSDNEMRVSLMLNINLKNPKTFAIVDRAVAQYTGEFIPQFGEKSWDS